MTEITAESLKELQTQRKEKAKQMLLSRRLAYARVFDENSPDVRIVLEDLRRFCRTDDSCFDPDERIHALREGRREVALRIEHKDLSPDEYVLKYGKGHLT
jgi:hypothetical protein